MAAASRPTSRIKNLFPCVFKGVNDWTESSLANEDANFYESLRRGIFDFFIVRGGRASRKDKRGADLISDVLPFGRLWYGEPDAISNAIGYAKFYSRSHNAVIRVYDAAGNVIETHESTGGFKEW